MSLRRGVIWTTVGNGVYMACQYAMLMALAKFGSPTLVGQFSLALAITAPVVIFSQMQLRQLQVTDVRGEYVFADYFFSRVFFSGVALAVIGGITTFTGYPREMNLIIGLVGLAKVFESLSDIVHGQLQRLERLDSIAVSLMIKGLVSLVVFGGVLWMTRRLLFAVGVLTVVWAATLVAYDLPVLVGVWSPRQRVWLWRFPKLGRLTLLALPLAVTSGIASLSGNIPRYFLEALRGKDAVGFFSVASFPLGLITLFSGAIGQATLSRAAGHYQAGQVREFKALALKITLLHFCVGAAWTVAFWFFGERLLAALFTPDYSRSAMPLVVMSAGITIGSLAAFGAAVLTAGRMVRLQLANMLVVVATQVPVCYYLVGRWGVAGAAWSEFGRYVVSTVFLGIVGLLVFMSTRPPAGVEDTDRPRDGLYPHTRQ